jgi:hypothetical protein
VETSPLELLEAAGVATALGGGLGTGTGTIFGFFGTTGLASGGGLTAFTFTTFSTAFGFSTITGLGIVTTGTCLGFGVGLTGVGLGAGGAGAALTAGGAGFTAAFGALGGAGVPNNFASKSSMANRDVTGLMLCW